MNKKFICLKLYYIINGECSGKSRFIIVLLLGLILTFTVSGLAGLMLILEALYHLFQDGKISKALYKAIVKALLKKYHISEIDNLLE